MREIEKLWMATRWISTQLWVTSESGNDLNFESQEDLDGALQVTTKNFDQCFWELFDNIENWIVCLKDYQMSIAWSATNPNNISIFTFYMIQTWNFNFKFFAAIFRNDFKNVLHVVEFRMT